VIREAIARLFWQPLLAAPRNLSELVKLYSEQNRLWAELCTSLARQPPRRHFVLLMVLDGTGMAGGGRAVELVEGEPPPPVAFNCNQRLSGAEVLVFCDLAAVQVDGVFWGNQLLALNVGSGVPIGFIEKVEPGQRISATVRLRRDVRS
jgi:hypothetical protein